MHNLPVRVYHRQWYTTLAEATLSEPATWGRDLLLTPSSIRHIKCDETRPACTRCTSTRRRCDGYLPPSVTMPRRRLADLVRQIPSLAPASETLMPILRQFPGASISELDMQFFDVFRHTTAPGTASLLPSSFWTCDLLRMAHGESAIWHATLSLGALHHQWEADRMSRLRGEVPSGKFRREALMHYFRAISLAQAIADNPTLRALSVVLVAVSNILGRWSDSRTHLFGGLQLLDRDHDGGSDVDSTAEMLERLDLQAMTFSDSQAPYPFESPVWLRSLHRRLHGTTSIESYGQAGTLIFALLRQFILTSVHGPEERSTPKTPGPFQNGLIGDLEAWEAKMLAFEAATPRHGIPALSICLYHAQLRLWIAASFEGDESRWDTDECLFYFDYIVSLAEALLRKLKMQSVNPLSLEPAVIVPLFSTAHRCRHPHLRRKALNLLKTCKRQEGMWSSDGAAAVVERIIVAEEGPEKLSREHRETEVPAEFNQGDAPDVPWDAWSSKPRSLPRNVSWEGLDITPKSRRVKDVLVIVNAEERKVAITMLFPNALDPQAIKAIDDVLHF